MIICESPRMRRWQGGCGGHFFRACRGTDCGESRIGMRP
jgi:hypothetical protein